MVDALFEVVRDGDFGRTEHLLEQGADPNEASTERETALHEAVRRGHSRIAALLLAHGADYMRTSASGNTLLSRDFTSLEALHSIRQHYQRLPLVPYKNAIPGSHDVARCVTRLHEDGFAKVSGFLEPAELAQLRADFASFMRTIKLKRLVGRAFFSHYDDEEYWIRRNRSFVTNNAFKYSAQLLSLCCSSFLVETANHYLQKPAFVQRASALRYLPSDRMGDSQFKWHHDMDDKRLKFMLLLTDVTEKDQYMTYVRGSHQVFHPYGRFLKNGLDFDYCRQFIENIEVLKAIGAAGDLIMFDSNGMHSANRSKSARRDIFLLEFSADKFNVWGGDLPEGAPQAELCSVLDRFLAVTPKWNRARGGNRRKATSWAISLEEPSKWV